MTLYPLKHRVMTFIEFMDKLYQIILDKVKEQGFVVILLLAGVFFINARGEKIEDKLETKIKAIESSLTSCDEERRKLSVELTEFKVRFEERISTIVPRRQKR